MLNSSLGSLRNGHENDFVWGFFLVFFGKCFSFSSHMHRDKLSTLLCYVAVSKTLASPE